MFPGKKKKGVELNEVMRWIMNKSTFKSLGPANKPENRLISSHTDICNVNGIKIHKEVCSIPHLLFLMIW